MSVADGHQSQSLQMFSTVQRNIHGNDKRKLSSVGGAAEAEDGPSSLFSSFSVWFRRHWFAMPWFLQTSPSIHLSLLPFFRHKAPPSYIHLLSLKRKWRNSRHSCFFYRSWRHAYVTWLQKGVLSLSNVQTLVFTPPSPILLRRLARLPISTLEVWNVQNEDCCEAIRNLELTTLFLCDPTQTHLLLFISNWLVIVRVYSFTLIAFKSLSKTSFFFKDENPVLSLAF